MLNRYHIVPVLREEMQARRESERKAAIGGGKKLGRSGGVKRRTIMMRDRAKWPALTDFWRRVETCCGKITDGGRRRC